MDRQRVECILKIRRMNHRLRMYWSLFWLLSLPAILYFCAIINIIIPAFFLWTPIYIVGVVPYILVELLHTLIGSSIPYKVLLALAGSAQVALAYLIAVLAVYGRDRHNDIGTISAQAMSTKKRRLLHYGIIYSAFFAMYVTYFAVAKFVS